MCIIMIKCSGADLPDEATFKRCCDRNKDGSGFMWIQDGIVHGKKGYKSGASAREAIMASVPDIKDRMIVFHARYATHGAVGARCCHPFPVTDNIEEMAKRKWRAPIGVAHNGVFSDLDTSKLVSDTMSFIKNVMHKHPEVLAKDETPDTMFKMAIGTNRLAVLIGSENRCVTFGKFEKDPDNEIYYSNNAWAPPIVYNYAHSGAYYNSPARVGCDWQQSSVSCAGCIDIKSMGDLWPCKQCFICSDRPFYSVKVRTISAVNAASDRVKKAQLDIEKERRKTEAKMEADFQRARSFTKRCALCESVTDVKWDYESKLYVCDRCAGIMTIG